MRNDHIGESVLLHAGQMLIVNPKSKNLPDPVDVDLDKLVKTSNLIVGFPPLASFGLISQEIQTQAKEKSGGALVDTNMVIFGGGTAVFLLDPTRTNQLDQANANEVRESPGSTETPTPTPVEPPTATPTKFGALTVINSPDPYVISNDTVIRTDPSIRTNGRTDFGKIYRGPAFDGTPSKYFFGSTTSFDTSSGVDTIFSANDFLPIALFKFQNLRLDGDPTISTAKNGATELGLISLGDITSGTAPATLSFKGMDLVFLASQKGSITLGSNLTFQNIPFLFLYDRGLNSTLTLDAAIKGSNTLILFSQGDIRFNNPFSLTETGAASVAPDIGSNFNAAGDLVASNGLSITLGNTGNDLPGVATTVISADGNLTIGGPIGLGLTIVNEGGHLGPVASLLVRTDGDLTANVIDSLIDNSNGGTIDGRVAITVGASGAIHVQNDLDLTIGNGNENGSDHGTIGGPVALSLNGGSISVGRDLSLDIANNAGGKCFRAQV